MTIIVSKCPVKEGTRSAINRPSTERTPVHTFVRLRLYLVLGVGLFVLISLLTNLVERQRNLLHSLGSQDEALAGRAKKSSRGKQAEELPTQNETTPSFDCPLEPCDVSIVFLGDSLSRFQYYSLAYFLRHAAWIEPTSSPNLVRPKDFLGGSDFNFWLPWYNASMQALSPYENCDCYREAGLISPRRKIEWVCENRYYHDPVRNNTLTYLQAFGNHTDLKGHWEDPVLASRQQREGIMENNSNINVAGDTVGPMLGKKPYAWRGDWPDAIRHHVSRLRPYALVMNAGFWLHNFDNPNFVDQVASAVNETGIPRTIWKTTTAARGGQYPQEYANTDASLCGVFECFNVSWTTQVPGEFYVDRGHFLEPVYRLLNEQLLEQLGIQTKSSERLGQRNWLNFSSLLQEVSIE